MAKLDGGHLIRRASMVDQGIEVQPGGLEEPTQGVANGMTQVSVGSRTTSEARIALTPTDSRGAMGSRDGLVSCRLRDIKCGRNGPSIPPDEDTAWCCQLALILQWMSMMKYELVSPLSTVTAQINIL